MFEGGAVGTYLSKFSGEMTSYINKPYKNLENMKLWKFVQLQRKKVKGITDGCLHHPDSDDTEKMGPDLLPWTSVGRWATPFKYWNYFFISSVSK